MLLPFAGALQQLRLVKCLFKGCCKGYVVKSSFLTFMKKYPSFILFNFEYVQKIAFLSGNLSYNLSNRVILKLS